MSIQVGDHLRLCGAGIALHRFDVAAAELQLHGDAAMPRAVKDDGGERVHLIELANQICDLSFLVRVAALMREHKAVVCVGGAHQSLFLFPAHFHFLQRLGNGFGKIDS